MDYSKNYLQISGLADRLRESAAQKTRGGFAERIRELEDIREDFTLTQANYFKDIQDMFAETRAAQESLAMKEPEQDLNVPDDMFFEPNYSAELPEAYRSESAQRIKGKLVEKGLPEHVASAFVMNFMDESGLNPLINEKNPLVKGSRGGFGLYQLTGPRRVSYEEYLKSRKIDPNDAMAQEDAQIDFMLMELEGPEKAAWKNIQSAEDTGTAAAFIVRDFLRPAEEHLRSRVKKYTGRSSDFIVKPTARPKR